MQTTIGVMASEHIVVGLVEGHEVKGDLHVAPGLVGMPTETIAPAIREQIEAVCEENNVELNNVAGIGIGFPGIIRDGVILESPNLQQVKGLNLAATLKSALAGTAPSTPVLIVNDADAMAAGIAATRDQLEKLIRVWTLGHGIGFGRSPQAEGVWEGGHCVVTLDPKEQYCGCGGQGHLEGIMGHRAMRLRFLDMEPEEIFANAQEGDPRCRDFVRMWHRALAAATASSVHMAGPGRFYISGPNAKYIEITLLSQYLHDMVKMSPLQGSVFEVVSTSNETAIVGAAVIVAMSASTASQTRV
jgi:predicted NBD/HSP70 family sugar kinase